MSNEMLQSVPYIFWGAILVALIIYAIKRRQPKDRLPKHKPVEVRAEVKPEPEQEPEVKSVKEGQAPSESLSSKMRRGRRTLPILSYVDFDPRNAEHCKALQGLMQEPQRLHPTLRFHFDPAYHDNAYAFMLSELAAQHIERTIRPKKASKVREPATVNTNPTHEESQVAVVPFRTPSHRSNTKQ